MKKYLAFLLILISINSYSQLQPYVDLNAVWQLPMEGRFGVDIGANYKHLSMEINTLFINPYRIGSTIGYQFGKRETSKVAKRLYGGLMYGEYSTDKEDVTKKKVGYILGLKLMQGSFAGGLSLIATDSWPEYYVTIGFQIVTIYKFITK